MELSSLPPLLPLLPFLLKSATVSMTLGEAAGAASGSTAGASRCVGLIQIQYNTHRRSSGVHTHPSV